MEKTETQISFRITNALKDRLEARAKHEDRSVAYIVRKAVEEYLSQREKEDE